MKALFLNNDEVEKNLPLPDLLDGIQKSFVHYTNKIKGIVQPQRVVLNVQNNDLFFVKPCISTPDKTICTKLLTLFPENESRYNIPSHQAVVTIFNSETGTLDAVMDGVAITDLRTAAATAVARKFLAPLGDGNILTIVGTGHQAVSHLKLMKEVSGYKEVRVCSRGNFKRAEEFAVKWGVSAFATVEEGVSGADIVIIVTKSSAEPVVKFEWLKPTAFVAIVGAPVPSQRDVDDGVMLNSMVVADSTSGSYAQSGDVIQSKCKVSGELGEVINGNLEIVWDKIRVFKSNGLAIQDLVAGRIVVNNYLANKNL